MYEFDKETGCNRYGESDVARFFLSRDHIQDGIITITGNDAHHISHALRMAPGDEITVCDMQKNEYRAVLQTLTHDTVTARVLEAHPNDTELSVSVHLYQALPKGEKMDFVVQKATEFGCAHILPIQTARCIVHPNAAGAEKKRIRWERIAHEAAKQCGRGVLPRVDAIQTFETALAQAGDGLHLFCYEGDGTVGLQRVLRDGAALQDAQEVSIWIGPEGGWSCEEVQAARNAGMYICGLGKRILRTESAALAVLGAIVYETEMI